MNQLQSKELEILKIFIEVCNKLNLRYFLVCGSALGAVKYQGFIPWDDDLDVGMYREDYEIFVREAPELLPPHIFFQSYKTDSLFPQIFGKLRDSRTTYIEKSIAHLNINHGVYIDIFPLDGYPTDKAQQSRLEKNKTKYKRQLACACRVPRSFLSKLMCGVNRLMGCHKQTHIIARKYEALVSKYSIKESKLICNHGNWQGELEYASKEQYGNGIMMKFEGLDVRVPEKYDEYLTQKYGDWRADLPKEKQVGHHYYTVCDLTKPYTEYIKNNRC